MKAGNTVESLKPVDVNEAVPDRAIPEEIPAPVIDTVVDESNVFDVSRGEFEELRDAFIRLVKRVNLYNVGAPHKI